MSTSKRSWLGVIFGLVFFAVGAAVCYHSAVKPTWGALASNKWVSVSARIMTLELQTHRRDSSTTYSLSGQFLYQYNGQSYTSKNITFNNGSDNSANYWQEVYRRLDSDRKNGTSLAWIDPDNPHKAVLNRDIRWIAIAFGSIFALFFCGAGGLIVWSSWRNTLSQAHQQRLNAENGISSNEKNGNYLLLAFGSVFFAIGALISGSALPEALANEDYPALFLLVFVFAGAWLMIMAMRSIITYQKVGSTPLFLSPSDPGVGGEFGASFVLNSIGTGFSAGSGNSENTPSGMTFTLNCIRRYRSGKHTRHTTLWNKSGPAHTRLSASGLDVLCKFNVPERLQASREWSNKSSIEWRLDVEGTLGTTNKIKFTRSWDVIIADTPSSEKSNISIPQNVLDDAESALQQRALESVLKQVNLTINSHQIELFSAAGRYVMGGLLGTVVGAVFAGIGYYVLLDESHWAGGLFICIGSLVGLASLHSLGSSILTTFDKQMRKLKIENKWFGIPTSTNSLNFADASQLSIKKTSSTQNGRKSTDYFVLNLKLGKDKHKIAQGIEGKDAANALKKELGRLIS